MVIERIEQAVGPMGLMLMGHLPHPAVRLQTIALIGTDANFWDVFRTAPEYSDGKPHPVDRWSKRLLGGLAESFDGSCVFPSDGPPYAPFIAWAQASHRFWQSPTGMLVHDHAGLMVSIRGALILNATVLQSAVKQSPCDQCIDHPCTNACPVGALSDKHPYDVPACKTHISSDDGTACMEMGCAARRACPVSQAFSRPPDQSAFHMRAFRGS
ncbi:ferredoxin [Sulfitobacter sp.]|uniref:ferredoxin n=1 Tax=Sulfitobacter sp. TaxID=1903071 RepID=UPI0030031645